jgi:hypothetical protein
MPKLLSGLCRSRFDVNDKKFLKRIFVPPSDRPLCDPDRGFASSHSTISSSHEAVRPLPKMFLRAVYKLISLMHIISRSLLEGGAGCGGFTHWLYVHRTSPSTVHIRRWLRAAISDRPLRCATAIVDLPMQSGSTAPRYSPAAPPPPT